MKHFALILSIVFLLAFVACGQGEKTEKATTSESQKATEMVQKKAEETTEMAKEKAVSKNTIVFNNLVSSIAEFKENWEVPASESWHSRFIK